LKKGIKRMANTIEFNRNSILEQIGQQAMELDYLVQPVIDEYKVHQATFGDAAFEELRDSYIGTQAWGRLWVLTTMEIEYEQAMEEAEEADEYTEVEFTFDQEAVVTIGSSVEVPNEVIAKGNDAVKAWIDDNDGLWGDDQPIIETNYGQVILGSIILNRRFDNG